MAVWDQSFILFIYSSPCRMQHSGSYKRHVPTRMTIKNARDRMLVQLLLQRSALCWFYGFHIATTGISTTSILDYLVHRIYVSDGRAQWLWLILWFDNAIIIRLQTCRMGRFVEIHIKYIRTNNNFMVDFDSLFRSIFFYISCFVSRKQSQAELNYLRLMVFLLISRSGQTGRCNETTKKFRFIW